MTDSWEMLKVELRKKGFNEVQIDEIYQCISEVVFEKGVSYIRL